MTTTPLMRVSEVADVLGLSRQRVYEMVWAGTIPHTRISPRSIRIPRVAFDAWLAVQAERAVESMRPPREQRERVPSV